LFGARERILRLLTARLAVDPHAVLDVVLAPRAPFPLDLLELLRRRLDDAPKSYLVRALALRGENAQRRLAVVLRPEVRAPKDWGLAVSALVPVFRDQSLQAALAAPPRADDGRPGARIVEAAADVRGAEPTQEFAALDHDPDMVVFADRALEAAWVANL
jgi:hypothetical protein